MPDTEVEFVEVPPQRLSTEALHGLVDEFVSREGTDYGDQVFSMLDKRNAILKQLDRGDVVIVFDPKSESCNIVTQDQLRQMQR